VFESDVLEDDVTIAGAISPELFVSTTGTDADFVVKLIDLYPGDSPNPEPNPAGVQMGGYQRLVRGEPFRGKFRNSFEKPEPFTPGKRERIAFDMPDVLHTFRRGHRIMVHIQSSWFPLIDRNPQKFVNIPDARDADFQKATHRVYRMKGAASSLAIGTVR
jgi:predicted acyl esterase